MTFWPRLSFVPSTLTTSLQPSRNVFQSAVIWPSLMPLIFSVLFVGTFSIANSTPTIVAARSAESLADISAALNAPTVIPMYSADDSDSDAHKTSHLIEAIRVRRLIELLKKRKRRNPANDAAIALAENVLIEETRLPAPMKTIRSMPFSLKSLGPALNQNREIIGWERLGWSW